MTEFEKSLIVKIKIPTWSQEIEAEVSPTIYLTKEREGVYLQLN